MSEHPSVEELDLWRRGKLGPDRFLAIATHLADCSECTTNARSRLSLHASEEILRGQLEPDSEEHPDLDTELFAYVRGSIDMQRRARIDEDLLNCVRCREDVDDLRTAAAEEREEPRPINRRWILAIAAAAAAIAISMLLLRQDKPRPTPMQPPAIRTTPIAPPPPVEQRPEYSRNEWIELVRDARSGKSIALPKFLTDLQDAPDILRGTQATDSVAFSPAGIVVESQRPTFAWPAPAGARSVVSVFAGDREVARSESIRAKKWTPPKELDRGVTYTWNVKILDGATATIVPAAPAPLAKFHVVDARTAMQLAEARREYPEDPLLLGLLLVRAGLEKEARETLQRVQKPSDVPAAQRILADLDAR